MKNMIQQKMIENKRLESVLTDKDELVASLRNEKVQQEEIIERVRSSLEEKEAEIVFYTDLGVRQYQKVENPCTIL